MKASSELIPCPRPFKSARYLVLCSTMGLLWVAFLLRVDRVVARVFHVDEYISMLAAQMTAVRGAPVLPSGIWYPQGLLTSYLAAPFVWLSNGVQEELLRWPSLLVGMFTVASYYVVARRLFASRAAGFFAMAFAALDMLMILWSSRVRMYAPASLFALWALYFAVRGVVHFPRSTAWLAAAICFLGAAISHSVIVIALPIWGLAILVTMGLRGERPSVEGMRAGLRQNGPTWVAIIVVILIALAFGVVSQEAFLTPEQGSRDAPLFDFSALIGKFLSPGISWQRVDDFVYYFTSEIYAPLALLAIVAALMALVAVVRKRSTSHQLATLCLAFIFLFTIAGLGFLVTSTWRKTRYLFILCQPAFMLLAADGLARLGALAGSWLRVHSRWLSDAGALIGVALIVVVWGSDTWNGLGTRGTGDYDAAFAWVEDQWREGDRVMTVHPSAAYLYLGRVDYYAVGERARVLYDEESEEMVDRYVGATLIDSAEALNRVLAESTGRLWFVVDRKRLFRRYDPLFTQQVFAQMDIVHRSGGVFVFLSHRYPRPVSAQPTADIFARFDDLVELEGYSVDLEAIAPDNSVPLVLYWRPLTADVPRPFKVFVQLRNGQGEIVAQADHYIFEGLLSGDVLRDLIGQGEWLRDGVQLIIPNPLPRGHYRLLVGLYDEVTGERVPVQADTSGENAVVLTWFDLP
ncbi:MAG: glycosyltransferase family 39 protein [Anaerolineae bacterium]